jgi:dUTPase
LYSGTIDEGKKEEIKILTYVKKQMQINVGDRIAQLLLFPYIKHRNTPVERNFGSPGKHVFC